MKFNLEHYFIFNFDPNNLENLFFKNFNYNNFKIVTSVKISSKLYRFIGNVQMSHFVYFLARQVKIVELGRGAQIGLLRLRAWHSFVGWDFKFFKCFLWRLENVKSIRCTRGISPRMSMIPSCKGGAALAGSKNSLTGQRLFTWMIAPGEA